MIPVVDLYREQRLTLDTSKDLGKKITILIFLAASLVLFFRWNRKSRTLYHTQYNDR